MPNLTGDQIYDLLEELKGADGKNARVAMLAKHADDLAVRTVFKFALDPAIRFGIKPAMSDLNFKENGVEWEPEPQSFNTYVGRRKPMDKKRQLKTDRKHWTEKSARLFTMAILKRLDCGMAINSVNKAIPGLIQTFDVMLAKPIEERKLSFPMMVEPKYDGMRLVAVYEKGGGCYRFYTRQGNEIKVLDLLQSPLKKLSHALGGPLTFDGEIVTGSFSDTISDVRKMDKQVKAACFRIFDVLPEDFLECGDIEDWHPMRRRREILAGVFEGNDFADGDAKIAIPPMYWVNSQDEIYAYYHAFLADNYEGAMVKDPEAPYHRKRNIAWMKVKPKDTADLQVIGAFEGTGKYEGSLGGLIVDRAGVEVRVGGGFSDAERLRVWGMFERDQSLELGDETQIVGKLIEVSYQEVTPDGSLRHPNFVRFRHDKVEVSF